MYERSYGYKYDEGGKDSTTDIAKRIRADIKQAIDEGLLPGAPVKYSVTSEYYSGGSSIDVEVRNWSDAWVDCGGGQKCHNVWCAARNDPQYAHGASAHRVLSDDAEAAKMTLERIHGAYNHDGSESQVDYFDVNYYGQVQFETEDHARFRAQEAARLKARREAVDQATEKIRVVNYSRTGGRVVHDAVKVDGKIRLVCGARLWSASTISRTDAELTCSRCAKKA